MHEWRALLFGNRSVGTFSATQLPWPVGAFLGRLTTRANGAYTDTQCNHSKRRSQSSLVRRNRPTDVTNNAPKRSSHGGGGLSFTIALPPIADVGQLQQCAADTEDKDDLIACVVGNALPKQYQITAGCLSAVSSSACEVTPDDDEALALLCSGNKSQLIGESPVCKGADASRVGRQDRFGVDRRLRHPASHVLPRRVLGRLPDQYSEQLGPLPRARYPST